MFGFVGFVAVWTAAIVGYTRTRSFVRNRLRYVDGVHKSFVPLKVGFIAAAALMPIAWVVPFVPTAAAVLIGTGIGWGVSSGRKDIRNRSYLASSYQ